MKKAMCKILPIFFVLVILTALALPCFADNINSASYPIVVDTGVVVTAYGQTSIGNVRPIEQFLLGFRFNDSNFPANTFHLTVYPADGIATDYQTSEPIELEGVFTSGITNTLELTPNYFKLDDLGVDLSIVCPYGYWNTINGNDGNVYDVYYSDSWLSGYEGGHTQSTAKIGFRAWTDSTEDRASWCQQVESYTITYTPAIWSVTNDRINLGQKTTLNSENAIYNAIRAGGYTTLAINMKGAHPELGTVRCTKYIQWVGYQGDHAWTKNVYSSTNAGNATSTDKSYQMGYEAGLVKGQQGSAEKISNAYQEGYDAGAVNSGFIPSALLAIGEIPFNLIHSFLNFDIFGFNIAALVGIIITGCAFIWVLKKFV